jgi:hypothetical protein
MKIYNIYQLFKEFIDTAKPEIKSIFYRYCLAGTYTYEEYMNNLAGILKSSGEGYSYKCCIYTNRSNPNIYSSSVFMQAYMNMSAFSISHEKFKFSKSKNTFDLLLMNPGFPFIFFPKLYSYIEELDTTYEFAADMILLIEEWKKYFLPHIIDFCSLKKYYIPSKNMYVYSNKNNIVLADIKRTKIYYTDSDTGKHRYAELKPWYRPFAIHSLENYD